VRADGLQALNDLESRIADLRRTEADLESLRQAHYDAGDRVNQAQGRLYEAGAEVARLEAEIRYVVEGRARVLQRIDQLKEQIDQWQQREEEAAAELERLAEQNESAAEQAEILAAQCEEQAAELPALEDALRRAQGQVQQQRASVTQVQQAIQVLAAEQRGIDDQARQLQQRRDRLALDAKGLAAPDESRLDALREQLEVQREQREQDQARLDELQELQPRLEEQRREAQAAVNREGKWQADLSARLEALRALQEKLKTDGKLQPWLKRQGLDGLQGLWTRLQVEPGWEIAVESALRERMGALEVSQLDRLAAFASDAPPAKLAFHELPSNMSLTQLEAPADTTALSNRLRLHDAGLQALLSSWLAGCWCAETLELALAARGQLESGQAVWTPAGHCVGAHHLSFYAPDSEQAGLLARAQEIDNLDKQLRAQTLIHDEARQALARAEAAGADASQRLGQSRREAQESQSRLHELEVELLRLSQQAEQARARREQIGQDLAELDGQLEDLQERRITAEGRFEELDLQLADGQERQVELEDLAIDAERRLAQAREQLRSLERQAQEATFSERSLQARRSELQRGIETARQQGRALSDELQRARDELARLSDAAAQGGLQDALDLRVRREQELAAQRSQYDELTARLRASDERRQQVERELEPLRSRITEFQLKEQAAQLGHEQFSQSLAEAQADLEALAAGIEQEGVRLHGLQAEIDRGQREIAALGAVNLAALDELSSARERKTFLDSQSADLNQAIDTLEDAIRKIDGETRELLGSTFETVNSHFSRMFPDLFGGGQARLIMTGDEILDAGVQVMAQPPGKKNQTIHLLSGGEKALTAIALVFAIFQLNPAPFCLLDEVDAPLDDANTERYARLVARMSGETQFLFISHNKIAMEMAQQLIGVTMQEQGVSRIVAVDMETATGMMESA
jgi:chromosome segregation protein